MTNTCGHRNDHVSLNYHYGKTGRHLAVPISDPNSKRSTVNTATTTTTATMTSKSAGTTGNDHSIEDLADVAAFATGGEKNNETAAVDYGGFHAWTRPYVFLRLSGGWIPLRALCAWSRGAKKRVELKGWGWDSDFLFQFVLVLLSRHGAVWCLLWLSSFFAFLSLSLVYFHLVAAFLARRVLLFLAFPFKQGIRESKWVRFIKFSTLLQYNTRVCRVAQPSFSMGYL